MTKQKSDDILEEIAKETLGIQTLETRNGDGFDFYDSDNGSIAVWNLKEALQKAYFAGRKNGLMCDIDITEDDWYAAVDVEENAIYYAHADKSFLEEMLENELIATEESEWLKKHPEHKDEHAPDEVIEALRKRFIIVNCKVTAHKKR